MIKAGETQTLIINANVANIIVDASHQLSITDIQATNNVEMIPNRNTSIMLNQLNDLIAEQQGVSVSDLATADPETKTPITETVDTNIVDTNTEVLTDDKLAAQYRSQADRLSKEAAALRRQAEELVPTKKKKKASV